MDTEEDNEPCGNCGIVHERGDCPVCGHAYTILDGYEAPYGCLCCSCLSDRADNMDKSLAERDNIIILRDRRIAELEAAFDKAKTLVFQLDKKLDEVRCELGKIKMGFTPKETDKSEKGLTPNDS